MADSGEDGTKIDRGAVQQSIRRLLLRKGEMDADDQHPLFHSGLTIPQMKVLFSASQRGGVRAGVIAERAGMAPPNVTSVLDRLVERGLVYRAPDPDDGRVTLVLLTDEGKRLIRAIAAAAGERINSDLEGMNDDELIALERGLRALVREMDTRLQQRS